VLVVMMGVAGVGKTTIGRLVAEALGLPFHDADDFHSEANKRKMAAGIPLTERDRAPWLAELASRIRGWQAEGGAVLGCSALRKRHRGILRDAAAGDAVFVFLQARPEVLRLRLATRRGHYMPASLLDSQLAALEPPGPDEALSIRTEGKPHRTAAAVVAEIRKAARARGQDTPRTRS
jgi:carbohydrate kinase (thermoresistant glucokinase family)